MDITGAVVFVDTETTKRNRGYRPWEIAMIRRESSGEESAITIFVDKADLDLANAEPEALEIGGFSYRHPQKGARLEAGQALCTGDDAAALVQPWTDSAMLFAVNRHYDAVGPDGVLHRAGLTSTWFYAPQSIDAIAYGFALKDDPRAPRSSEPLSKACGVDPPGPEERHTAMGDALWVRRWFDALNARESAELG